ncbi:hypothetical protein ACIHFB_31745 [Streptomyces sp. NPDC051963]|uniref:hypothetical protein n=1 Tax=Streptomyces sp. NPDC051963 TaxID=3365678 RepID=UPI0037D3A2A2
MPRRPPSVVRRDLPVRFRPDRVRFLDPQIGRLSAGCAADIRRLERQRFGAGTTARAFRSWSALAHGPLRAIAPEPFAVTRCGLAECCEPDYSRDVLEEVLHALPARSARELRRLVAVLDARIVSRAQVIPVPSPGVPWWREHL